MSEISDSRFKGDRKPWDRLIGLNHLDDPYQCRNLRSPVISRALLLPSRDEDEEGDREVGAIASIRSCCSISLNLISQSNSSSPERNRNGTQNG